MRPMHSNITAVGNEKQEKRYFNAVHTPPHGAHHWRGQFCYWWLKLVAPAASRHVCFRSDCLLTRHICHEYKSLVTRHNAVIPQSAAHHPPFLGSYFLNSRFRARVYSTLRSSAPNASLTRATASSLNGACHLQQPKPSITAEFKGSDVCML